MSWSIQKVGKASFTIEGTHGDSLAIRIKGKRAGWDGWTWDGSVRLFPASVNQLALLDVLDSCTSTDVDLKITLAAYDSGLLVPETVYSFDVQGLRGNERRTIISGSLILRTDVQRP